MPDELQPQMEKLRAYVADVAMMEVMELADEMAGILK